MRIVETLFASSLVALFGSSALGQQGPKEAVFVGPWSITTTYKADRFENCTMSRTGGEVNSSFLLTKDEMLLELELRLNGAWNVVKPIQ